MNNKILIVAICVVLVLSIINGVNYLSVVNIVENYISKITAVANTIFSITGNDFGTEYDYFRPEFKDADLGTVFYNNKLINVNQYIKNNFIPTWYYELSDRLKIQVFPNYYKADFVSHYQNNLSIIGSHKSKTEISNTYIIRFFITFDGKFGEISYYLYLFYDNRPNVESYSYFITLSNTDTGYYSNELNTYDDFLHERDDSKKLNSSHIINLNPNISVNSDKIIYRYDSIENVQATDKPIGVHFDKFLSQGG